MEWAEPKPDDMGRFIRDHILPRITQLEEEVRTLRKATWPVCQALTERSTSDDIKNKWHFISQLDEETGMRLVANKQKVKQRLSEKGVKFGMGQWRGMRDEWEALAEFGSRPGAIPTHVYDEFLKGKISTPTNATDLRRVSQEGIHIARAIKLGIHSNNHHTIDNADLA